MKSLLKSSASFTVLALLSASPALSADAYYPSSSKDAPISYSEGVVNWTGFYFGGQVGYGISQHDLTTTTITDFPAADSRCWARGFFDSSRVDGFPDINFPVDDPETPEVEVDERDHVIEADLGASITDVTEEECSELRDDLAGMLPPPAVLDDLGVNVESGYDPAVEAHTVTNSFKHKESDSGLEGGVRVGFDLAQSRFLAGLFGEYNWSAIDGKEGDWALGGRIGYIIAPRTLLYGLAAYTQSEWEDDLSFDGWKVGGGVEIAVGNNVFVGAEYTHSMYGEETVFDAGGVTVEDELTEDKFMLTLKAKMNSNLGGLGF